MTILGVQLKFEAGIVVCIVWVLSISLNLPSSDRAFMLEKRFFFASAKIPCISAITAIILFSSDIRLSLFYLFKCILSSHSTVYISVHSINVAKEKIFWLAITKHYRQSYYKIRINLFRRNLEIDHKIYVLLPIIYLKISKRNWKLK